MLAGVEVWQRASNDRESSLQRSGFSSAGSSQVFAASASAVDPHRWLLSSSARSTTRVADRPSYIGSSGFPNPHKNDPDQILTRGPPSAEARRQLCGEATIGAADVSRETWSLLREASLPVIFRTY